MKEARNFPIEPGEQFNYYEGDEWLMFTAQILTIIKDCEELHNNVDQILETVSVFISS